MIYVRWRCCIRKWVYRAFFSWSDSYAAEWVDCNKSVLSLSYQRIRTFTPFLSQFTLTLSITHKLHQNNPLKTIGNLLVTKDCRLRIADFGLARERPTGHGKDPDEEIDGKLRRAF
jgi:hypothetical protein